MTGKIDVITQESNDAYFYKGEQKDLEKYDGLEPKKVQKRLVSKEESNFKTPERGQLSQVASLPENEALNTTSRESISK